ncbi:MAG: hypothetical protein ACPGVB_15410 [Chitinophagales bacterium]
MPFKSTEIRWFSSSKEELWNIYQSLPQVGEGIRESDRIDYYLQTDSLNTGVKIRQGNHEIKVKYREDELQKYGLIEHWQKWSTKEEQNILNTIDPQLLEDWIAIEKKRFKKKYEIWNFDEVHFTDKDFLDEGCGVEFTELKIGSNREIVYTFGIEAFGTKNDSRDNFLAAIQYLKLDFSVLEEFDSFGYPEFLSKKRNNNL